MRDSHLKIPGIYKNLAIISDFVVDYATRLGFQERGVQAVQMAVDEACTNIIEHAYGGEGKGDIELLCQQHQQGIKVVIKDTGNPFNPDSVNPPDLEAPLEERDIGGLGLFLMRKLMDDVHFSFESGGNTLVMIKKRGQ